LPPATIPAHRDARPPIKVLGCSRASLRTGGGVGQRRLCRAYAPVELSVSNSYDFTSIFRGNGCLPTMIGR